MTFFTIRKKLICILVGLPMIPLLVFSFYFLGNIKKQAVQSFISSTNRELRHVDKSFVFFMDGVKNSVNFLATIPELDESYELFPNYTKTTTASNLPEESLVPAVRDVLNQIKRVTASSPLFVEVYLGTEKGGFLSSAHEQKLPAGYDPRKRGWYQLAEKREDIAVTPAYLSSTTGDIVVGTVIPVPGKAGRRIGVAGIDVSLKGLSSVIRNIKIGKTGFVILAEEDGTILAAPQKEGVNFKKMDELGIPAFTTLAGMRDGHTEVELDGEKYLATVFTSPELGYRFIGMITNAEVAQEASELMKTVLIISSIMAIAFVFLGLWLANTIVRPINNTSAVLKDIAQGEGDLTKRLDIEKEDELGHLAHWFNVFIEKLQGIIKNLETTSSGVTTSSSSLEGVSKDLQQTSERAVRRSANMAAAAEEMNANLASVAAAMEESAANTSAIASAAEEMNATIGEIATNSEQARTISSSAVTETKEASSYMEELGLAADQIGKVTETITEISEQTNLLALNATIEAARAGEAGKGFAVVANEIKELAKQTADATLEIKNLVEAVQDNTGKTGKGIENIAKVISDVNEIVGSIAVAVGEQTNVTNEIAGNISQVSHGIQDVNENITDSSEASANIVKAIEDASSAAEKIAKSSREVGNNAQELSSSSDQLQTIIKSFKV